MDRNRAKELLPIIEAFANGEDIDGGPIDLDHWQGIDRDASFDDATQRFRIRPKPREWWLDPCDGEVWPDQPTPPIKDAIKVREVL
jgi:hypothetical protein